MRTIEIPRTAWADRLDEFSQVHEGWLVSLDVLGPEIGAQPEIDNLPLLGVSEDRVDGSSTIAISVARSPADYVTHQIHAVAHVHLEQTDDGADAALQVESADGTKSILRFRAAALPETVDGLAR